MKWKNLTIGKKIGLGFGTVLIFLGTLALIGNNGIGSIVANVGEIVEGNKLLGNLAQKEVDHMNWAKKVNLLLTDDRRTTLEVQTDDHKCGFGKWLYGQGRKQAEQLVPALAPLLKQIEEPHKQLHASAIEIGRTFRQRHSGLMLTLSNRLMDHVNWTSKVGEKLAEEAGGLYSYQTLLKNAVDQAHNSINAIAEDENLGGVEERKARALNLIKSLRYGPEGKDYFWINDMDVVMVMHPYKPELNGNNLSDSKDPKGKKLFVEFVRVCGEKGEGFVDYYWPKYGADKPVPKLSFVKLFKDWNWVIGTGVYLDHSNPALLARAEDFAAGNAFSLGVQIDPAQCAFGKFLNDPKTRALCDSFPEFKAALEAIHEPHNRLHETAVKIENLVNARNVSEAVTVLKKETQDALKDVRRYFAQAMAAEEHLIEGSKKANQIYATRTIPNLEKVQGLLKKVRDTANDRIITAESLFRTSAQGTKRNVTIVGVAAVVLGVLLAFFIARGIITVLKRISVQMSEGAEQVAGASGQVLAGSQSLADGASEQAASIEETSSSLEQMSSVTKQNTDHAKEADDLMKEANQVVAKANNAMAELITSMGEISSAGEETSKIIKSIDEIAFQTNLLALNAAVEAARAGEAGAGFAVVADEVRNLAMRAADAAKNTAILIEGTVTKVNDGSQLVNRTNEAFTLVAESAAKVGELVAEIATASNEQAQGIEQVNAAVAEMDKVVQQNAASAEESASAAGEMNAQAEQMKTRIHEMAAMVSGSGKQGTGSTENGSTTSKPHPSQDESSGTTKTSKDKEVAFQPATGVSPDQIVPMADEDFEDF